MLPNFDRHGHLPPGEHPATWEELRERFGQTARRRRLLDGLTEALSLLKAAGCRRVFLDGSFVTAKEAPGDFDGCWDADGVDFDALDERLLTFDRGRATQKAAFLGELFIADQRADPQGTLFRELFQTDRDGRRKGIVVLDLKGVAMITNQRQYAVSKAQAERFRDALAAPQAAGQHPRAAKAMRAALQSQLDDIEAELGEYEALREGRLASIEADSILGIGEALVKARIVRNLTQRELADRLAVAEQQVQRYEATQYRGVAAERLQQVADALKLSVKEVFVFERG